MSGPSRRAEPPPELRDERSLAGWLALAAVSIALLLIASQGARSRDCSRAAHKTSEIGALWTVGIAPPRLLPPLI